MNGDQKMYLKMLPGVRWEIMRTLGVGGHLGATESMLQRVIDSAYVGITATERRNQLAYLESRKLIEVERSEIEDWRAVLTRHGTDLVEYRCDCEPGIARPSLGQ